MSGAMTPSGLTAAPAEPYLPAVAAEPGRPTGGQEALDVLLAGNRRFAAGQPRYGHLHTPAGRAAVQRPYALVLGCLDSRAVPEAIFDLDFGDVMVVRTGGHVLDSAVLGSIDFAVTTMQVPLLLVLGHQYCGAIAVTVSTLRTGVRPDGPIAYLADEIAPSVGELAERANSATAGLTSGVSNDIVDEVVRRHLAATVDRLRALAPVARRIDSGTLAVVGAHYDVDTGQIDQVLQ